MINDKQHSTQGGMKTSVGRKVGSGKFRDLTSALRIPSSQASAIKDFLAAYQKKRLDIDLDAVSDFMLPSINRVQQSFPLYSSKV